MFSSGHSTEVKESLSIKDSKEEAKHYLDFVGLKDKKDTIVKNYTLANRKALEIARGLATEPKMILLDEVGAGLNPSETLQVMEVIKRIRNENEITVLWIEHVMKAIMNVADKIIVLSHGEKISEGTPKEIACDEKVIEAYLGEKYLFQSEEQKIC